MKIYFVYVLLSGKDRNFYVGYTKNLKERLRLHKDGRVKSTRNRGPLKLIYAEICLDQQDALHRERYLKSTFGKRYLRNRLKNYLTG